MRGRKLKQPEFVLDLKGMGPDARAAKIMGYFDGLSPRLREAINRTGVNPSAVAGYMKWGMSEGAILAEIERRFPA